MTAARMPVVLIHGWNGWPSNWQPVARELAAAEWPVFTPRLPLPSFRNSIRHDAATLDRYLRQHQHAGKPLAEQPILLVGYSRGGLVARSYTRQFGTANVRGMVHIGVPHLGVPVASLALFRPVTGLMEMKAGSEVLAWLNESGKGLDDTPQLAIWGHANDISGPNDLVVWQQSATLDGRIPGVAIDLRPNADAWHGNLINKFWWPIPVQGAVRSERVWPETVRHLREFMEGL